MDCCVVWCCAVVLWRGIGIDLNRHEVVWTLPVIVLVSTVDLTLPRAQTFPACALASRPWRPLWNNLTVERPPSGVATSPARC